MNEFKRESGFFKRYSDRRENTMKEKQISRYLELVNRRLVILLNSGINWKPEYEQELADIDRELYALRELVDAAHEKKGVVNYGK